MAHFFRRPVHAKHCLRRLRTLRRDPSLEIIGFDSALCTAATTFYGARTDKSWGVTDCLSFILMQQRGLTAALSSDHHFEQAGFSALLLDDPPP